MKTIKYFLILAFVASFMASCQTTTVTIKAVEFNPEFYNGELNRKADSLKTENGHFNNY